MSIDICMKAIIVRLATRDLRTILKQRCNEVYCIRMWGNFKGSLIACSSPFASFDKDLIRRWKILLPVQTLKRFQSMYVVCSWVLSSPSLYTWFHVSTTSYVRVTLSSLALRPRQSQAAVYDLNHRHWLHQSWVMYGRLDRDGLGCPTNIIRLSDPSLMGYSV